MTQDFGTRPAQMTLVNMVTGVSRNAQFNPTELEETFGANYAKLTVVGLSHQRKHFINTEEGAYSFELFGSASQSGNMGPAALQSLRDDRRFLIALAHPWRADGINRGGPPRTLFIWPKLLSLTCILTKVSFRFTTFNREGAPVAWRAKVSLEEIRDVFVSMEDILNTGTGEDA